MFNGSSVTRRTYLKVIGGTAVCASSVASGTSTAANQELQAKRPILGEVDDATPLDFATQMHLEDDPAGDGGPVVRTTSNGENTTDYASGIINISDQEVTLGDVSDGTQISYDYYFTEDHTNWAPDDVFVLVQNDETADDEILVAFQARPADVNSGDWHTRDVSAEILGNRHGWRARTVQRSAVRSGRAILKIASSLRDSDDEFDNLVDEFGSNATIMGVGFGCGRTLMPTVNDLFVNDLVVGSGDGSQSYPFPAAVPMSMEFQPSTLDPQAEDPVMTLLEFTQSERGLSLDGVVSDSVKLTPFIPAAPPVEDGVQPNSISVADGQLQLEFIPQNLAQLVSDGDQRILVSGEFEDGNAFVAVGTLSID